MLADLCFFFSLKTAEPQYKEAFDDELNALKERVRKRAIERQREAEEKAKQEEEEERKVRLPECLSKADRCISLV